MLNRRRLIAALGGVASGLFHPLQSLRGQTPFPSPTPGTCKPATDALKLDYTPPADESAGIKAVTRAFEQGVKLRGPSLGIAPVMGHLTASYREVFAQRFREGAFAGEKNPLWVVLLDHAFILGQLTVTLRPDVTLPALKPRDVLRAQAKFAQATSSLTCDCYIPKFYALPAAAPKTGTAPRVSLCDQKPTAQIDEECVLCG